MPLSPARSLALVMGGPAIRNLDEIDKEIANAQAIISSPCPSIDRNGHVVLSATERVSVYKRRLVRLNRERRTFLSGHPTGS